jgi:hypothetical protein
MGLLLLWRILKIRQEFPFRGTDGLPGAQSQIQLGPVLEALLSLVHMIESGWRVPTVGALVMEAFSLLF